MDPPLALGRAYSRPTYLLPDSWLHVKKDWSERKGRRAFQHIAGFRVRDLLTAIDCTFTRRYTTVAPVYVKNVTFSWPLDGR